MNRRNKLFYFGLGFLFLTCIAFAQNAEKIIKDSRDRIQADTVSTRARMIITNKDGSKAERLMDQYSKDEGGRTSTIIIFQQPASVANTRFLTIEKSDGSEDRWIFLPALGKVRRVAASEGSGRFVGTDFSYDDISSANRDADADIHTMLREETYAGTPCYVIESTPKDKGFQYSKIISWITKDTLISSKMELFDQKGIHIKTVEMKDIKNIQGRLTPTITKMSNLKEGTSTEIKMEIMKYDDPIPSNVFTTDYLATGRLR